MGKRFFDEDGVIYDGVIRLITEKQQAAGIKRKKELEQRRKLYEKIEEHCGNFYFYRYDKLIEQLNDDTATAFRFLYVCTCANKDGKIIAYDDTPCRTISDFTYVFEKTIDTVKHYLETIMSNNLIYKKDGCYWVNPIYYVTNLQDSDNKKHSVRVFNEAIRHLYRNSNPKEHSLMGQFLKLVPYINIYTNILCWDIGETDPDFIHPLTKQEIQKVLKDDAAYGCVIFNKLEKVFIKGEPVMGRFISSGEEIYRINPRLFYRGNNVKQLQDLIDTFDINKNQYIRRVEKKKMKKMEN